MFKLPLYYKKDVKTLLEDNIIKESLNTDLSKYENLEVLIDRALTVLAKNNRDDIYSLCFIIKYLLENDYELNENTLWDYDLTIPSGAASAEIKLTFITGDNIKNENILNPNCLYKIDRSRHKLIYNKYAQLQEAEFSVYDLNSSVYHSFAPIYLTINEWQVIVNNSDDIIFADYRVMW